MTRTELTIQILKVVIGLAFAAYFVWWSLQVLDRLTPEYDGTAMVGRIFKSNAPGAYFVWWSLQVLDRLTPEYDGPTAMFSRADRPPWLWTVAFMGRALPLHAVLAAGD